MRRMTVIRVVLGLSFMLCAAAGARAAAVAATDPNVRYVGRFDTRDRAGPRCAWPASSVIVRFHGTNLAVKVNESGDDRYDVVVDGKVDAVLALKKGEGTYPLAAGLPEADHRVEMVKRTESFVGVTQFLGFELNEGGKMLPPVKRAHRLEVIGDSISCGYGNEGKNQNEHFAAATENADEAYGALAARALGAEYVCVAWSGRKMWPDNTIPEIYDLALPADPKSKWDFSSWTPDAVVINLATNDFRSGNPDEEKWTKAYETFVDRVRKNYPKAEIYCASGSMLNDAWPAEQKTRTTLRKYLTKIVEDEAAGGDKKLHVLEFEPQDMKNGMGSDWHPSVKTHQIMADKLAKTLEGDLGWKAE